MKRKLVPENLSEAIIQGGRRVDEPEREERMRGTGKVSGSRAFAPWEKNISQKDKIRGMKKAGKFSKAIKAYTNPKSSRGEEILRGSGIDPDAGEQKVNQQIWNEMTKLYKQIKSAVYNSNNPSDAAMYAENEMSKILSKMEYKDLDKKIFKKMDY